jgi:putative ABC transport system permease protein
VKEATKWKRLMAAIGRILESKAEGAEAMFRGKRKESDFRGEIEAHIRHESERLQEQGMSKGEALAAARRAFGNVMQAEERFYEASRWLWWDRLKQDIRYGLRMLRESPSFAAVTILTLAFGIGANTAIFSFIDAVLLKGLPYHDSSHLIELSQKNPQGEDDSISPGDFVEWRGSARSFEEISFAGEATYYTLTGIGDPDEVCGVPVSHDLFRVLGVHAALGRTFASDDRQSVILSDHYWRSHFFANPRILGQIVALDGKPFTVVGVMPTNFYLRIPIVDLWVPFALTPQDSASHDKHSLMVIARLKRGFTLQQARAEMRGIQSRLANLYQKDDEGWTIYLERVHDPGLGEFRNIVVTILGAVLFTLLIACINVANMFLARGAMRQRELAVRAALGAVGGRLIRQLLTETVLVSAFSGFLGLVLAMAAMRFLVHLVPAFTPDGISGLEEVRLNLPVLWFALVLSLVSGLAVGIVPSLRSSRLDLNETLRDGAPAASASKRKLRLQGLFVAAQVALTLILLVGAGLMMESSYRLANVHVGFDPSRLLTVRAPLIENKYVQGPKSAVYYRDILNRIRAIPGAESVALVNNLPLSGFHTEGYFELPGAKTGEPKQSVSVGMQSVSPGYFRTMGIPLLSGRDFTIEDEQEHAAKVMIVDETAARRYWPDQDLIGKSVLPETTVVGVVANTRRDSLREDPVPQVYVPYSQRAFASFLATFVIRANHDALGLIPAVRGAVWSVDSDQPLIQIRTMQRVMDESIWRQHFSVTLLFILAAVALLLSIVGVYGIISYSVGQRTHEIGIRVALGAARKDVLKLVIGQGFVWILFGVIVGLAGAFALTRFLTSMLFDVRPTEPVVFAAVVALLSVAAAAACYVPARRAMRVDPIVALRYE